jgi:MoaA/NifB/PqqE/SkfB family radical SAM enzyme
MGRFGGHLGKAGSALVGDPGKMGRYGYSFLRGRLVHTNLQLLYDCNFKCQICDFWKAAYRGRPRLTVDQVRTIASKLDELGPQIVSIGGGEPLLHDDIAGVVRALAQRHFPVMICNGWFVTAENARALFEAGIYEVSISVDYADPEKHDAQRGTPGAYRRAIEALQTLHKARVHPWQRVHMISVVMDDNVGDLESLIRLSRDMGITYLVTLYSDWRGRAESRATRPDISRILLDLKDRYPDFVQLRGYLARFTDAIAHGGVGPCYAGKHLCNVDCQGDVTLCIDRLDDPVGNLLRDDARVIERRLLEKHRSNECRRCWTSCRGSIETLMYGGDRVGNLVDYFRMTRPVSLSS